MRHTLLKSGSWAVRIGLVAGFTVLVGCTPEWASLESRQGTRLAAMLADNTRIPVTTSAELPLRFDAVEIQKRFTDESGTQYRALAGWRLTGSLEDAQEALRKLASERFGDIGGRRVVGLTVRVRYLNSDGKLIGAETLYLSPDYSHGILVLPSFAKDGQPASVEVAIADLHLDSPLPQDQEAR